VRIITCSLDVECTRVILSITISILWRSVRDSHPANCHFAAYYALGLGNFIFEFLMTCGTDACKKRNHPAIEVETSWTGATWMNFLLSQWYHLTLLLSLSGVLLNEARTLSYRFPFLELGGLPRRKRSNSCFFWASIIVYWPFVNLSLFLSLISLRIFSWMVYQLDFHLGFLIIAIVDSIAVTSLSSSEWKPSRFSIKETGLDDLIESVD
jgi:hypothetical protein